MAVDYGTGYIDMNLADPNLQAWDGVPSRLDQGDYQFEVVEATKGQTQAGNPALKATFKVVSEGDNLGRTMKQTYTLIDEGDAASASRGRLKQLVQAAGIPLDERGGFSVEALIGCQVIGTVIHEEVAGRRLPNGQESEPKIFAKITQERPVPQARPQAAPPRTAKAPAAGKPVNGPATRT